MITTLLFGLVMRKPGNGITSNKQDEQYISNPSEIRGVRRGEDMSDETRFKTSDRFRLPGRRSLLKLFNLRTSGLIICSSRVMTPTDQT